jgi:hypothetical protein
MEGLRRPALCRSRRTSHRAEDTRQEWKADVDDPLNSQFQRPKLDTSGLSTLCLEATGRVDEGEPADGTADAHAYPEGPQQAGDQRGGGASERSRAVEGAARGDPEEGVDGSHRGHLWTHPGAAQADGGQQGVEQPWRSRLSQR